MITLTKAEPSFPYRLTTGWMAVMPKELAATGNAEKWGSTLAVGTGPYQLVENTTQKTVLSRNDNYWGRKGAYETISFSIVRDDQLRLEQLKQKQIDATALGIAQFSAMLTQGGTLNDNAQKQFDLVTGNSFSSSFIGINNKSVPDVHLRRALYFSVDRSLIAEKVFLNTVDVTGGTVPPGMQGYQSLQQPQTLFNLELAEAELAKSSYKGETLEFVVGDQAGSARVAQIVQQQWKEIGVTVTLTQLDMNGVIGRILKGDAPLYSMYLDYVFSSPEPILFNVFSSKKIPILNLWFYSNPEIDKAIDELMVMPLDKSRVRAAEIEQQVMADAPAVFLYRPRPVVLQQKGMPKLTVNGHGFLEF